MEKNKQTTLRAPVELLEAIELGAKKQGQTRNGLIRQILWDWVRKNKQPA